MSEAYRTSLPIVEPIRRPAALVDTRDSDRPDPISPIRPPEGAPNVLIILLDDMGFGAPSSFGGPCRMPTSERLAASGVTMARAHTTAICSCSRAALLTGRNHHSGSMGILTELATSDPGYTSSRPPSVAPLAEILRQNGYSTAAFGKWHQTPVWETSMSGPFDHWPTGEGFEHFYGFLGGETDQWNPTIFQNTSRVETPDKAGYHFSVDITDRLINYVREQQAITPDKPFFTYLAFGATHAPHHAPREYLESYRGQFDQGWDAQRIQTLARQKQLGIVAQDAELTLRPDSIGAWADQDPDRQRLFARMMEAYAASATHTDDQVGRVVDALEEIGVLDNTLVFYLMGDNGASAEGGMDGTLNEWAAYNQVPEPVSDMLAQIDDIGSPMTFNHYTAGWAHAMNTPYQWTKQLASHWGGTRNAAVVHWPVGIAEGGVVRTQFSHVIDIAPTVLAAANIPQPRTVNGVDQKPLEGASMLEAFNNADAPDVRDTQYFEVMGNRAIYHKGWSACTAHNVPWVMTPAEITFAEDSWELYSPEDYSQSNNIAAQNPEMLRKLQELFLLEGSKYQVFPMDDRKTDRLNADAAGRPTAQVPGATEMTLYPGMSHLGENVALDVKNRSHTITAQFTVERGDANGALIVQGGRFGGWAVYLRNGVPSYCYDWVGRERYFVAGDTALQPGEHTVRVEFQYDGGGVGKGATVLVFADGAQVAQGRVDNTCGYLFSSSEGMDIGFDNGAPVVEDYGVPRGRFQGSIAQILLNVDPQHHHDPEGLAEAIVRRQ
ncbi:MAG: arylsulfatase [Beutenbergiaceae bacterium]